MLYYIIAKGGLADGDVLVSNHPLIAGGSHLPDITAPALAGRGRLCLSLSLYICVYIYIERDTYI